ncbi:hypothetical protein L9F63_015058, partial [Diploptera punctata]
PFERSTLNFNLSPYSLRFNNTGYGCSFMEEIGDFKFQNYFKFCILKLKILT